MYNNTIYTSDIPSKHEGHISQKKNKNVSIGTIKTFVYLHVFVVAEAPKRN